MMDQAFKFFHIRGVLTAVTDESGGKVCSTDITLLYTHLISLRRLISLSVNDMLMEGRRFIS